MKQENMTVEEYNNLLLDEIYSDLKKAVAHLEASMNQMFQAKHNMEECQRAAENFFEAVKVEK